MPLNTARGVRVPTGGDAYNLTTDLRLMAQTINPPVAVANITARTAVVAALAAEGNAVSVSKPLFVVRADAPALERLEVSYDGSTWTRYKSGAPSGWVDLPLYATSPTIWAKLPDAIAPPAQMWLDDKWVHCQGLIRTGAGGVVAATSLVGAVPPSIGLRPTFTHHCTVATQNGRVILSVDSNGEIKIVRNDGYTASNWLDLTNLKWPVA